MGNYYRRQEQSIERRRSLQIMGTEMYKSRADFPLSKVAQLLNCRPYEARAALKSMVEENLLSQVSDNQWKAPVLSRELLTRRWV